MKEFVEYVIRHLVEKPDEVVVSEIMGEKIVVYEVRVWKGDIGKVIGTHGQIVKSLQNLLTAAAATRRTKKPFLEILKE